MIFLLQLIVVLLLRSLPERVLYATIHSWLMYPRSMKGHPMRACCLMAFFRDRCTSGGSVSAMISLGGVLGAVESWRRMDMIILAMVSGVMLVMAVVRVARWAWVIVESREQHRTWSVVSRHSLQRGQRIKSSLLILRRWVPVFHHPLTNLLIRRCIVGGRDLIDFSKQHQSIESHVSLFQSCLSWR